MQTNFTKNTKHIKRILTILLIYLLIKIYKIHIFRFKAENIKIRAVQNIIKIIEKD